MSYKSLIRSNKLPKSQSIREASNYAKYDKELPADFD